MGHTRCKRKCGLTGIFGIRAEIARAPAGVLIKDRLLRSAQVLQRARGHDRKKVLDPLEMRIRCLFARRSFRCSIWGLQ